jgi:hypothetical protein
MSIINKTHGRRGLDACERFLRDFVSVAKQFLIQPST